MRLKGAVFVLLIISFFGLPVQGLYSGGGTEADPYIISTAAEMNDIGIDPNDWDKHFKLMADIDLGAYTGTSFNIIGLYVGYNDPCNNPFTGVFDGNGHTISNFTYSSTGTNYIGIFGYVNDPNAEIKNLGLIDPNVAAGTGDYIGSLVGYLRYGAVTDCNSVGGSVSGYSGVGGLVGNKSFGTVSNSYSSSSVSGDFYVGGLVGCNDRGDIFNSYATGSVSGNDTVGGLVGVNSSGTVSNSYAVGDVNGVTYVGGLVGHNWGGTVSSSYSSSSVSGDYYVGGLVGQNDGWVSASFWDVNSSGLEISDGGTPKTTAEMQTKSTFTDAGWDFIDESDNGVQDIWDICEGTNYPKLAWQIPPLEDFVCPDGVDFVDFAILGSAWRSEPDDVHWNSLCDISEPNDSVIDGLDLDVFGDNWLTGM